MSEQQAAALTNESHATEEHSPLPWTVYGGWDIHAADNRHVMAQGRPVREHNANAEFIVKAANNHDELVTVLRAILNDASAYQWHGPIRDVLAKLEK